MLKKVVSLLLVIVIAILAVTGCGLGSTPGLNVKSQLKTLEKNVNKLNTDYFVDNVYVDPIETDSEVVIASIFLGNMLFEGAGSALRFVGDIALDLAEQYEVTDRKELAKMAKGWKEKLLSDFEYEITDYQIIEDAQTIHEDAVVVLITHRIEMGMFTYSDNAYIEYVYQDKKWKFHIIPEDAVYAGLAMGN